MVLLSSAEDCTEPQPFTLRRPGQVDIRASKWQKPVLELFRSFFGLIGFCVGMLMLLLALVWIHSVMH